MTSLKLSAATDDRLIFSRQYIESRQRDSDLDELFAHKNQPYPPFLSQFGSRRFGKNFDLIEYLVRDIAEENHPSDQFDAKVLEGAATVHALPSSAASTFAEYARDIFVPFATRTLGNASRTDIVWDDYRPASLKETSHNKGGKGSRKMVAANMKMLRKCKAFLEDCFNKMALFAFLTAKSSSIIFPDDKIVIITPGKYHNIIIIIII